MSFRFFQRLRHSRGFGVHSPYAYRFVKSVLNPRKGYLYYSEEDLEGLLRGEPDRYNIEREARTLLRLAAFTTPASARLPKNTHKAFRYALQAANHSILISENNEDVTSLQLVATTGLSLPLETLARFIALPDKILLIKDIPQEYRKELFDSMKYGVLFEGKRNCILISRPEMQKVHYLATI